MTRVMFCGGTLPPFFEAPLGRTETPMARESEVWDPAIGWLDAVAVAKAIVFCIQQDSDTIIPEFHVLHRAEI